MLGTLCYIHASKTDSNGTRGDNDHSMAIFPQFDRRVDNQGEDWKKRFMSVFVDN